MIVVDVSCYVIIIFLCCKAAFGTDQVFGSTSLGGSTKGHPCFFQRCLAVGSVSTVGVLLLLCKWAFADDDDGVGQLRNNPTGSMDMLLSFLSLPKETGLLPHVDVVVAGKVACRHPRPLPSTATTIRLPIDNNCIMQLDSLRDLAHGPAVVPGQKMAKQWANALGCNHTYSWTISLQDFFGKFAKSKAHVFFSIRRNLCFVFK